MSIPKAASSLTPKRPMNSATAAAAMATVSIRLGKLNSVVSTVNPYARPLRKPLSEDSGCFLYHPTLDQESEGLTRGVYACQEKLLQG